MHVIGDQEIKGLQATEPGELIRLLLGPTNTFAIVLGHERGSVLLGVLQPLQGFSHRPVHMARTVDGRCVSYGLDWAIEPVPGEEFWSGNKRLSELSAVLYLHEDHWTIGFQPGDAQHFHADLYFNLDSRTIEPYERHAAPISTWRLWQSAEAARSPTAQPLLIVTAA